MQDQQTLEKTDEHCLAFSQLPANGLCHGVFTRHGGVSEGPWDSCNVSFFVGDGRRNVQQNRERIKNRLRLPILVSARQVHGDRVYTIQGRPAEDIEADGYDSLITNIAGVALMVQQADCQAVLLADHKRSAVGIVHVGWRGSVADIIAKTIAAMQAAYGTEPADIQAAVSPSLGPCCAEFVNYKTELPKAFHSYRAHENHFDFWAISRDQLQQAGVRPDCIAVSGICTVCNTDFFSYRRNKVTGRFASVIGIDR